jgi:hypothetical protein
LGKNNSQEINSKKILIFEFLIFGNSIETLVMAQGMKAKNRFQFKKMNNRSPVYAQRNTEIKRQNNEERIKKIVSYKRLLPFKRPSIFPVYHEEEGRDKSQPPE